MKSLSMAKDLYNEINPRILEYLKKVNNISVLFEKAGGPVILK